MWAKAIIVVSMKSSEWEEDNASWAFTTLPLNVITSSKPIFELGTGTKCYYKKAELASTKHNTYNYKSLRNI